MTEAEWMAKPSTGRMIHFLEETQGKRRLTLFTYAICCRVAHLITDDRLKNALEVIASRAEGASNEVDLERNWSLAREAVEEIETPLRDSDGVLHTSSESSAACAVLCATAVSYSPTREPTHSTSPIDSAAFYARAALSGLVYSQRRDSSEAEAVEKEEDRFQASLLRCIFGNPFRPVSLDASWLTSTVVAIAEGIYADRAFDRLPILADALEDAGCDHADILAHCRGTGPHARGCWVVDLILGKE